MPDANKHAALEGFGFRLARTCASCVHWSPTQNGWGRCTALEYKHEKHSEPMHPGTPSNGSCRGYRLHGGNLADMVGYDYLGRYRPDTNGDIDSDD